VIVSFTVLSAVQFVEILFHKSPQNASLCQ